MTYSESERPSAAPPKPLPRLIFPIFYRFRVQVSVGFLALVLVDFLQLTIPRYLKTGVDALAQGTATGQSLALLSLVIILTGLAVAVLRFIWRTRIIGFSRHLEVILRNQLFAHILDMDQAFFDRHSPGGIMAHASNDLLAVQMTFGLGMAAAADALVLSVITIFFMAWISPSLTLLALAPLPLLAFITWILSNKLHKRFHRVQEQFGQLTEFTRNTIISIRLIKSATREQQQIRQFKHLGEKYIAANVQVAFLQGILLPIAILMVSCGMLLVLYFGGIMVMEKSLSLGEFIAFNAYLTMLIWPMSTVGWISSMVRRGLTSLARIDQLLQAESLLLKSVKTTQPLPPQPQPHFSCRGLNFSYPNSERPTLEGLNLDIRPGFLAITGRTGSGKSTLCKLLLRYYPVADGQLFFSGIDVNQLDPSQIRRHISYVDNNPILFSGTLAENIRLSRAEASLEEVQQVAYLAGIAKEIEAMPRGYHSRIGERGLRLSGGQKQRLALARALLADRPIIILDDALSALDTETGQQVFTALRNFLHGKTLILVSHRLQFLAQADEVLFWDQGCLLDRGPHHSLLTRNALYRDLTTTEDNRA